MKHEAGKKLAVDNEQKTVAGRRASHNHDTSGMRPSHAYSGYEDRSAATPRGVRSAEGK